MILDLDRYHVDLPYPTVNRVRKDKELIKTLLQPYSGEHSELTTLLQYAHHSLCCKDKYKEVSKMMRGIFYIETMHLEFIGDILVKLGVDPKYIIALKQKQIDWQPSVISYETRPSRMLLADIEGEKGAAAFYEQASESTKQPEVAKLLARLALDEHLHHRMLSDLYDSTFRK